MLGVRLDVLSCETGAGPGGGKIHAGGRVDRSTATDEKKNKKKTLHSWVLSRFYMKQKRIKNKDVSTQYIPDVYIKKIRHLVGIVLRSNTVKTREDNYGGFHLSQWCDILEFPVTQDSILR